MKGTRYTAKGPLETLLLESKGKNVGPILTVWCAGVAKRGSGKCDRRLAQVWDGEKGPIWVRFVRRKTTSSPLLRYKLFGQSVLLSEISAGDLWVQCPSHGAMLVERSRLETTMADARSNPGEKAKGLPINPG